METGRDAVRGATLVRAFVTVGAALLFAACGRAGDDDARGEAVGVATGADARDTRATPIVPASVARSSGAQPPVPGLARAAGGADGLTYRIVDGEIGGAVTGRITTSRSLPADTTIVPTHDLGACARFVDHPYASRDGGVGNAVVWLAGVSGGPRNDAPRRATIRLQDCQMLPRIMRVAAGGTVIANSRDAMTSRLRFTDVGTTHVRALLSFNDAGQVVPSERIAESPGVVMITDDMHPWVRGYLAVGVHPFVAITDPSGQFRFERVPPGSYTVQVWHERLGVESVAVTVGAGATVESSLTFR